MTYSDAYLVGYYGMKNSGDDALLAATAWGAKEFLDSKTLTASTPIPLMIKNHSFFEPNLKHTQRFKGQNRLINYMGALKAKRVIFGGGSVLHTAQDINIKRHMMKLAGSNKNIAVGVGIGPFIDTKAERACARFLNECHKVSVRDQESLEVGRAIAPNANIQLSFDLAPLLLKQTDYEVRTIERSGIAVCLCPKERLHGDFVTEQQRLECIADALIKAYKQTGQTIHLISFNGHDQLGDDQINDELEKLLLGKASYQRISYDPNPYRVLQRLAGYKAIISMRLHGSILGFLADTPVLSLNYHTKCTGWCQQIGMPDQLAFDTASLNTNDLANSLIEGLDFGFKMPEMTIDQAVNASLKNWH